MIRINSNLHAYNTRSRNENVINLLLLKDGDKEHLVWIKDYGKFQCMDYKSCKMYWCGQCLSKSFDSQEKLNEHLKLCMTHEAVKAITPEQNKVNFNGDRENIKNLKIMVIYLNILLVYLLLLKAHYKQYNKKK